MDFEDIKEQTNAIEGFSRLDEMEWLFDAVKQLTDDSIVAEIGALFGRITCVLGFACVGTQKHVFSFDPFFDTWYRKISFFDIWWNNIKKHNLLKYVTPVVGYSQYTIKIWTKKIDLLFIDGSHKYEDVIADFNNFYPYILSGGIIAFHDVDTHPNHTGVVQAWDECSLRLIDTGKINRIAFGTKS